MLQVFGVWITIFSPTGRHDVKSADVVGAVRDVGVGGFGHLALWLAKVLRYEVVVLSGSKEIK